MPTQAEQVLAERRLSAAQGTCLGLSGVGSLAGVHLAWAPCEESKGEIPWDSSLPTSEVDGTSWAHRDPEPKEDHHPWGHPDSLGGTDGSNGG